MIGVVSTRLTIDSREDCQLLFEGSKTFWRTRTSLDIAILDHRKLNCYEIIAFNAELGLESKRLYLHTLSVQAKLNSQEIENRINEKKEKFLREKKSWKQDELKEEVMRTLVASYIVGKLALPAEKSTSESFEVELTQDFCVDSAKQTPLLFDEIPSGLKPVTINFAKKSNMNDFQNKLKQLQKEASALKNAADQANTLAGLAKSTVNEFQNLLAKRRLLLSYSPSRLRWIRAINKTLMKNFLSKVRVKLVRLGYKLIDKRSHMVIDENVLTGISLRNVPPALNSGSMKDQKTVSNNGQTRRPTLNEKPSQKVAAAGSAPAPAVSKNRRISAGAATTITNPPKKGSEGGGLARTASSDHTLSTEVGHNSEDSNRLPTIPSSSAANDAQQSNRNSLLKSTMDSNSKRLSGKKSPEELQGDLQTEVGSASPPAETATSSKNVSPRKSITMAILNESIGSKSVESQGEVKNKSRDHHPSGGHHILDPLPQNSQLKLSTDRVDDTHSKSESPSSYGLHHSPSASNYSIHLEPLNVSKDHLSSDVFDMDAPMNSARSSGRFGGMEESKRSISLDASDSSVNPKLLMSSQLVSASYDKQQSQTTATHKSLTPIAGTVPKASQTAKKRRSSTTTIKDTATVSLKEPSLVAIMEKANGAADRTMDRLKSRNGRAGSLLAASVDPDVDAESDLSASLPSESPRISTPTRRYIASNSLTSVPTSAGIETNY